MVCPKKEETEGQVRKLPRLKNAWEKTEVVRKSLATFYSHAKTTGDMVASSQFLFLRNRNTEKVDMLVYFMWNQKHFMKALMKNVMFSFLHQKTYIVGKKGNIYGVLKATCDLIAHIQNFLR